MTRIVIYGNSGSGKTTLAHSYAAKLKLKYLDLDTITWDAPGVRKKTSESIAALDSFIANHDHWVIEGCYGSIILEAAKSAQELIFLNPGIQTCLENCKARPWEPHKYDSKESQDKNLEMLLNWVTQYETREDEFSLKTHRAIFDSFTGKKVELKTRLEMQNKAGSM
ncbi:MAG TPA: shikimate kinase [Opitutae bacterium]|nr:shikimate kinase [Puniceicoccaceae bacterium]HBR95204.1 shikimate kinase [Opitutae bacterium]|tara:strand:+ start:351 stop:851 length:501 start_codon:yes stop_codon:yes gene_type:complete